ncbi:hypothetical protein FBZ83_104122 [Azospirillum brasilense]|uniref:Secreted protein n=1 Tax=Azospirillum brasilense TaxID=192 RepID=A0A560CJ05_AZOBR|nr:hypothetical protein [Azospirillum brasilense]TWA84855.1 hypothetical protein FBZ83_104122 [Azospirillum brasilense]
MDRRVFPAAALLALMALPVQAQGQDGTVPKQERLTACRDEVSRFSDLFLGDKVVAGGRNHTALTGEQKDRLRGLLGDARSAAGKGDPDGCVDRLREARALVRNEGVGTNVPIGRGSSGSSGAMPRNGAPNASGSGGGTAGGGGG